MTNRCSHDNFGGGQHVQLLGSLNSADSLASQYLVPITLLLPLNVPGFGTTVDL